MTDLVQRLSNGEHPLEISLRPERTLKALEERFSAGFVHVRFTSTRGGTELGIPIDRSRSDASRADFSAGTGTLRIVGDLTLDYEKVRCTADIDLSSLSGTGHLTPLSDTSA